MTIEAINAKSLMARRDLRERVLQEEFRMCKRVTAHHMRTIYLEQCGITMGFDPIRSTMSMRKDGMTGMTRRRGRPCAWPPARGVCGVPPPLKPPFEIGDPLEVMNSM